MNVVVVESPAKAKTINKYLGPGYKVLASFGHIRDLPAKDGSVKPDEDFDMSWEVDDRSGGTARVPAPPWLFGGADLPDAGLPPFQGEHNAEVLAELGLSPDRIDDLARRGILVAAVPQSQKES